MNTREHKMKRIPRSKLNQIPFIKKINVNLTNLNQINYISGLQILNISGNPLQSFENLPEIPTLHTLIANNTQICSLKGALLLPALQELSLLNTPLSTENNFDIMCLSAFGSTIRNLNDGLISNKAKQITNKIRSKLYPYLFKGYILDSIEPLVVYLPNKLPRLKIKIDLELSESQEKENQIEENKKKIEDLKLKIRKLQKERNSISQDVENQIMKNYTTPVHIRKKKAPPKKLSKTTRNPLPPQTTSIENAKTAPIEKENNDNEIEQTAANDQSTFSNITPGEANNEAAAHDIIENVSENSNDNIERNQNESNLIQEENEIHSQDHKEYINNEDNQNNDYFNDFMDEDRNDNNENPIITDTAENNGYVNQQTHEEETNSLINEEHEDNIDGNNHNEAQDDNDYLNQLMEENHSEDANNEEQEGNNNLNQNEAQDDNDYLNQLMEENHSENANNEEQEGNNNLNQNEAQDDNEYLNQLMENENATNTNNEEPEINNDLNQNETQDDNEYLNQLIENENANNTNNEEQEGNNDQNPNETQDDNEYLNQLMENNENENATNSNNEELSTNNDQNPNETQEDEEIINRILEQAKAENNNTEEDDDALLQQLLDADQTNENEQLDTNKRMPKPPIPANSKNNSSINISALRPAPTGHKMMSSASIDQELNALKALNPPENYNSGFIKPDGADYDNLSEIIQPTTLANDHSSDDILKDADVSNDDN